MIFSFAIWNDKKKELFLARDRFGIRPIYYSVLNNNFIFGSETHGLPQSIHELYKGHGLRVPMDAGARCLNLSNTVAIIVYEALRQQGFPTLSKVNTLEG